MKVSTLEDVSLTTIMLTLIAIIIAIIILNSRFHIFWHKGPGPWGIPFFGFYPFLRNDYHVHLAEMAKVYGDPYLLSMGGKLYLHLNSFRTLREAHLTKSDYFPGRCNEFNPLQHLLEDGLAFINEDAWRLWRKFMGQSMREIGLAPKEQLKGGLSDSVQAILNALAESKSQPVDIGNLLCIHCTEIVRRLTLGNKVSFDEALKINKAYHKGNLIFNTVGILLCGSIARYFFLPRIKTFKELLEARKELDAMLYGILAQHKNDFDPEHPKDFIDLYLREKKTREEKGDPQTKYFTDKILVGTLKQVYGDTGYGIGAYTAGYLQVLASKVDVQNAIYEEIRREIGTERLPTYEDRNKLPFTSAVIKEIERTSVFLSVTPGLECNRDTTVSGIFVPKGTITMVNFYAINKDSAVYKDPERFDPERFMPDEKTKRPKEDPPMSFGIGKRACAGEPLVRSELFVFLTAIMQHFSLQPVDAGAAGQSEANAEEVKLIAIPRHDASAT